MLTCVVGKNNINTFDFKDEKLREWSNKSMLKCPACGEKMLYCHGDFKIPYFRHDKNSSCPDIYSEGVTEEHIKGIKLLYEWLKTHEGVGDLQLEKWISETRQRPDIYFKYNNEEYVIEYQCSPIATKYNERHDLYRLNNINDIWILGVNKYSIGEYDSIKDIDADLIIDNIKLKTIELEIYNSNDKIIYLNEKGNVYRCYDMDMYSKTISDYSRYKIFNINKSTMEFNKSVNNYRFNEILNQINNSCKKINTSYNKKCQYSCGYSVYSQNININIADNYYTKRKIDIKYNENINVKEFLKEEYNILDGMLSEYKLMLNGTKKLNDVYKKVNNNCRFELSDYKSSHYDYCIEFKSDILDLTFYVKPTQIDMTELYTYTKPFRGKRGGIGWNRCYGHRRLDSYNYENIDEKIFNKIHEWISNSLRKIIYS